MAEFRSAERDSAAEIDVPDELAGGPDIRLFCDPDLLARIDAMGSTHPDRADLIIECMLSARGNYSRAVGRWADDVGLSATDARTMITHRMPFWP